ncbi:MAG: phosphoglycerate kinase [Rhodospirillaceae bacterium]|nr:phosphoglycerate kinase [Rhodospirillaceae bacterium]
MPAFKTLDDIDVSGKRVVLRADLNVPIKNGKVTDETRILRLTPTIKELAEKGARVIVLSHFGRPKGKVVPDMSLMPLVGPLSRALGGKVVHFATDCVGPAAEKSAAAMAPGEILLLENLRFHAEEEADDAAFAKQLAGLGDIYVNDAFSTAHRAHASTAAIARMLPAVAGRLMEAELKALAAALEKPARPVAAIVGGAKISTKLELLGNLVAKVDDLVIGGAMANTFLAAQGIAVGKSLCEHDMADAARDVLAKAKAKGCTIHLPSDVVVAAEFKPGADSAVVPRDAVPADRMILDIGPQSARALAEAMAGWKTLVWNGPLGAFEAKPFDAATNTVAAAAAQLTKSGKLLSVAGGGDTVAALNNAGVAEDFSYVSTAGGAFLEWLEGKTLPGVAALEEAAKR